MADQLYASVTNTTGIISVSVTDSHVAPTSTATIVAVNTTLSLGDSVDVDLGYVGNYSTIFSGYVKNIERKEPDETYMITCANAMIRAVDYFIASTNPENPFTRKNIKAEILIKDLLALPGLTNYGYDATSFTFGIKTSVEVNLTSCFDYCRFISDILAWHLYADRNGKCWFVDRRPYPTGSDTSSASIANNTIVGIGHLTSDKDIRNRVVVYGSEGIYAEASASSPYLPAGFYRTAAVSAPGVIDTQSMASQAASYNLDLYNRLTYKVNVQIIGNPNLDARICVTMNKSSLGVTGLWYVYSIEHSWSKDGYTTSMDLRK